MEYDMEAIRHRQKLFVMTMRSCFMGKLDKYHGHMENYGVHIDYRTMEGLTKSHSFEDNIDLILCKSSTTINPRQAFKKIGNRLSLGKFFRWIYLLVQRTKAARVLSHMNGVSQQEIKDTVLSVGAELGVAYEYQLMMLHDDSEVIKLARHAVTCMMFYLNGSGSVFSVGGLLQAVMEIKPQSSRNKDILKVHPLYVCGKQTSVKWKVGQLFKQPGLRIHVDDLEAELADSAENEVHSSETGNVSDTQQANDANIPDSFDNGDDSNALLEDGKEDNDADAGYQNNMEEVEICLDEVSSVILGQSENHLELKSPNESVDRRISTIEMDYELGKLHIEKHSIIINDFSPVEDQFKDFTDGTEQEMLICEDKNDSETYQNVEDVNKSENGVSDASVGGDGTQNATQTVTGNTDSEMPCDKNEASIRKTETGKQCGDHNVAGIKESIADIKPDNGSEEVEDEYKFYGCFTPYGAKCRPEVYGFRGPVHVWNNEKGSYGVAYRDKVTIRCTYNKDLPTDSGNLHQAYKPKTKIMDGEIVCIS